MPSGRAHLKERNVSLNIQFTSKSTSDIVSPHEVDEAICNHFGAFPDATDYYKYWFTAIALPMAVGLQGEPLRDQLKAGFKSERLWELNEILDFIEEHYTVASWRESNVAD